MFVLLSIFPDEIMTNSKTNRTLWTEEHGELVLVRVKCTILFSIVSQFVFFFVELKASKNIVSAN